jgi:PhzF family phenazine biosynthesis protein
VKPLSYVLADVFTNRRFGGNQLAVFPQVGDLPAELTQAIAGQLDLSETVFVFPPKATDLSFSIRIFTPGSELPFAGHPTIGAAIVLEAVGALKNARNVTLIDEHTSDIVLGEGVGPVPVRLSRSGTVLRAVLTSPRFPAQNRRRAGRCYRSRTPRAVRDRPGHRHRNQLLLCQRTLHDHLLAISRGAIQDPVQQCDLGNAF